MTEEYNSAAGDDSGTDDSFFTDEMAENTKDAFGLLEELHAKVDRHRKERMGPYNDAVERERADKERRRLAAGVFQPPQQKSAPEARVHPLPIPPQKERRRIIPTPVPLSSIGRNDVSAAAA
jgi:hypothetical protein